VRYVRSADAKGTASRAHAGFRLFASRKKAVMVRRESLLVGFRLSKSGFAEEITDERARP
jgi:hypothetical protein